ncbi:hypothetical protein TNCT_435021 [Trichonephila clavata]|uniref:Uncharacterized protein n=1 Tax=Trichonephila clavata TaxID=2740835 RepID=A0A8X6G5E6_TRICU|nr:hypothetical protein TNCT_435021 [Trichonephila clavata]
MSALKKFHEITPVDVITIQVIHIALNGYLNIRDAEKVGGMNIFSDSTAALQAVQKGESVLVLNMHNVLHKILRLNKKLIMQQLMLELSKMRQLMH